MAAAEREGGGGGEGHGGSEGGAADAKTERARDEETRTDEQGWSRVRDEASGIGSGRENWIRWLPKSRLASETTAETGEV